MIASWTAPGDDAEVGQATTYDLRVGTCPYDHLSSTLVSTSAPRRSGELEAARISGLVPGRYCLGLVTRDEASNASLLSDIASVDVL